MSDPAWSDPDELSDALTKIERLKVELQLSGSSEMQLEAEIARLQKQCEGLAQAALNNGQDLLLHESMVRELRGR